ncbi:MAG TPA: hypothetical protein VFI47_22235 [Acidimicrobiales bacterium]|nr:hypothetical protein [Acidimicrobiales bacterium]
MTNILNGLLGDARQVIIGALVVTAMVMVIATWARTRSLVPTVGAAVLGGVVLGIVTSYSSIKTETNKDVTRYSGTTNATVDD